MADSSKRLWFKQAIVKSTLVLLSTKSTNVPEIIIPQAYIPQAYWPTVLAQCSAVSLVWETLGSSYCSWSHAAINKQVVTTNVESWKKATQTNQFGSRSPFWNYSSLELGSFYVD